jgi:AcrR family transcriptional regulator
MSAKEEKIDPRVKRTRRMIESAFAKLLNEKSFDELTVQDITQEAVVNRSTFYAHYSDKYALLDHTMHESFARLLRGRLPENAGFAAANVKSLIVTVCEFLSEMSGQCKRMQRQFEPLVEKQIKEIVREIILEWLIEEKGSRGSGVSPEISATVASWSIYGAALQWSRGKRKPTAEEFAAQLLPLVMAGLEQARSASAA